MSSSLVEMVAAIALAGIIFAGALIPVTSSLNEYQETEFAVQRDQTQRLAALRIEQIVATLWRSDEPPAGFGTLSTAQKQRIASSSFEIRENSNAIVQEPASGSPAVLAQPVDTFALEYLLDDGTWDSSVSAGDLGRVIGVRYAWTDNGPGQAYCGFVQTSDQALACSVLLLATPEEPDPLYRHEDHVREITLSVQTW